MRGPEQPRRSGRTPGSQERRPPAGLLRSPRSPCHPGLGSRQPAPRWAPPAAPPAPGPALTAAGPSLPVRARAAAAFSLWRVRQRLVPGGSRRSSPGGRRRREPSVRRRAGSAIGSGVATGTAPRRRGAEPGSAGTEPGPAAVTSAPRVVTMFRGRRRGGGRAGPGRHGGRSRGSGRPCCAVRARQAAGEATGVAVPPGGPASNSGQRSLGKKPRRDAWRCRRQGGTRFVPQVVAAVVVRTWSFGL